MSCTLTAPTLNSCNDLKGGVKTFEIALWEESFDSATATWVTIPLRPNAAYGKDTPTVNAENNTSFFTHEVFFQINGIDNFTGWGDMVQARIAARATTYTDATLVYGVESGLSFSGGERTIGQNLEDLIGSTLTYTGVSSVAPEYTAPV